MKQYIEIIKCSTQNAVRRIDVSDKTDRSIDKIDAGININLNHEEYYTKIVCTEIGLDIIN